MLCNWNIYNAIPYQYAINCIDNHFYCEGNYIYLNYFLDAVQYVSNTIHNISNNIFDSLKTKWSLITFQWWIYEGWGTVTLCSPILFIFFRQKVCEIIG